MSYKSEKKKRIIGSSDMVVAGILLGFVFWILETTIHVYAFHQGSFLNEILPTDPNELWMRSLVVFLMILFGIFAQQVVNKRRRAEEALKVSEKELCFLSKQLLTVQEDERARVSRDLRDNINQHLCAIKFMIEKILNAEKSGSARSLDHSFEKIVSMIQEVIERLEKISINLRPGTLDDLGILFTIQSLLEEFQELHPDIRIIENIRINEEDVPQSLKITIYRILQDALKIAALHSKTGQVTVSLDKAGDRVIMALDDKGTEFDRIDTLYMEDSEKEMGFASMKKRTELSEGMFSIETKEGWGTCVRASWQMQIGRQQDLEFRTQE
ncbi:MAG: histidine kinase [Acidobacteriota bacterium]|jgi:signal transduction histidine kinase